MSLFYINKDFHFYINFNFNIINYIIIRKRFNIIKTKNIINHMQNVFIYIRDNLNKTQFTIIEQINYYKKNVTFKKDDFVFFNNKNIIINKSFKKLNNKIFDSFKIIFIIDSFYKLKLFKIMKSITSFILNF